MRHQLNRRARPLRIALLAALACAGGATIALAQGRSTQAPMAMKPVVCRAVDAAKGKSGDQLAAALEAQALEMHGHGYGLSGLLAGEAPVACYRSLADASRLPRGAR
jgi:hypothetical protein